MKIEDIIIERDHHRHRHHHLHRLHLTSHPAAVAAATTTTPQEITSLSPPVSTTVKRSSSLAINAPFPKNHKNETTCTKMSDENNSISATAIAIKNGLNGATNNTSSISSLTGTSSLPLSSSSSSTSTSSSTLLVSGGAATVAAITDTRIHVSRANPNSNHHHHSTSTSINNGAGTASTTTTATTTISSRHHVSGITRIKSEPVENIDGGADYSMCKSSLTNAGAAGSEIVGRIPTSSSLSAATAGVESTRSSQGIGGRLQFFKDGKFILELARAKEGEKSGWVSVPRKQFRSPSAASSTVTPTYPKNESSTSLSFSDDNSSIQSSPWQRDHCWKQSTPRRGISKEMCFHFKRTKHILVLPNGLKTARIKRRKPLDNSVCQTPFRLLKNGCSIAAQEIKNERYSPDNSSTTAMDDEKSSDESSTEKDSSGRESSKTPTPETQSDTVDGPLKAETVIKKDNQLTRNSTTKSMNGEKRLKPRAKLTTIIQKLIDRLPTGLFHLSKTQIIGGATQQQHAHSHSHHQSHSSHHIPATSSRLASELHYHQQHVSPRKRILREFEKVSLEDTPPINSKRSRAKGNSPAAAAAVGTLPLTPIPTSRSVVVPSSSNNYVTNGNRTEVISTSNSSNTTPSSTPTRLYSSYSIHSLLGGNNNSSGTGSGSSNNNANNNRIKTEHSINQSGGVYSDPSYLRAMLASPKSPEGCINTKSLSAGGSAKKRSPPYSPLSEIHHQHQHHSRNRSPNVDASYGNMRSPPEAHSNRSYGNNVAASSSRLTPPHGYLSSPKNSSNSSTVDGYKIKSENLTNSSPNHNFYSPYMLSPKYVPPPNSVSPNSLLTSDNYHPKLKGPRSPSQQGYRAGVYRTQSPHAASNHSGIPRESSPPNALQSSPSPGINNSGVGSGGITSSSLSSTPRTVPKKTVSIRRQFASPSSSSSSPGLSEHLKNAGSNNVSKVEERTAMSPDNRRTPTQDAAAVSAAAAAAANKYHQHAAAAMMQRSSPLSGGASSLYYMYPPPNGSPSPHHSSSSPSPSPSSSYIPPMNPYYHPYVSTLAALRNPLWMHHYPAAAAAAAAAASAAAAMLPSAAAGPMPQQAMPFFPYNGVSVTTSSHLHHSSFAPMHLTAAGQLGLQPPPPPASLNRSPPTTDDTISPSSIKEEHSSDVPLNLSKH